MRRYFTGSGATIYTWTSGRSAALQWGEAGDAGHGGETEVAAVGDDGGEEPGRMVGATSPRALVIAGSGRVALRSGTARAVASWLRVVEHGHHQAECLVGGEYQGRRPQSPPKAVAAVGTPGGLHRNPGLMQARHIPAGGTVGHSEPLAEFVGGDPRSDLEEFERL